MAEDMTTALLEQLSDKTREVVNLRKELTATTERLSSALLRAEDENRRRAAAWVNVRALIESSLDTGDFLDGSSLLQAYSRGMRNAQEN